MKNVAVSQISKCRLCHSKDFEVILDLGAIPITSYFPLKTESNPPSAPLTMIRCLQCGLIQLKHSVSQDFLFGNIYGYRTGLNTEMVDHVEGLASRLTTELNLTPGNAVLDIGSNDGTFLNALSGKGLTLFGVDPNIADMKHYYNNEISLIQGFFNKELLLNHKFDLISSIAMFYDVEDPVSFAQSIYNSLTINGVWFFEQSYALTMFKNASFDTICHEHLMYYTFRVINEILFKANMKAIKVVKSSANGGSIGIFAVKEESLLRADSSVENLLIEEDEALENAISEFATNVGVVKVKLLDLMAKAKSEGKKVWCLGASTKGNTILSYLGLDSTQIEAISDRNESKFGRVTPGTRIPILPKESLEENAPAYALVLPWHFKKSIIQSEMQYLMNGGTLIFPLPFVQEIKIEDV